ncbi:MAG: hypothetical protein COV44_06175 [Deltaproteobacteria bacterium CG11_big_fil_rev_8_21_14_0_20_45_16]|nr:MAG: hypothetical protein COV44_06175 [Deltaproteobacteria bacterium CG11_big_fil_rev_8_21_14_0_20_45_16]
MEAFEWIVALLTLTGLEIVLGIDNLVMITILTEKLPKNARSKARRVGLILALIGRVIFLSTAVWLTKLTTVLFVLSGNEVSIRDIVLASGGVALLIKATLEIASFVEAHETIASQQVHPAKQFWGVIIQIFFFDFLFSLDSVLTAIGLTQQLPIMVLSVMVAIVIMIVFVNKISDFVEHNPAIRLLALAFLILIGVLLIAEGFGSHVDRSYVYFAMCFSLAIELLNRRRQKKVNQKKNGTS